MSDDLREFLRIASVGGGRNFRAIGNCRSAEGKLVAANRVFRSGHLGAFADELRASVARLGVRTVVTFQTHREIEILGDPLPEILREARWEHIPIGDLWFQEESSIPGPRVSQGEFYVSMVVDHAGPWARFLRVFTRPENFSILYHCTAGRDRTGVATVLLLETVGVPRPAIVEDYLESNRAFSMDSWQERDVLDPLFARIDEVGGIDRFLEGVLGLEVDEIEAVRANLLSPIAAAPWTEGESDGEIRMASSSRSGS